MRHPTSFLQRGKKVGRGGGEGGGWEEGSGKGREGKKGGGGIGMEWRGKLKRKGEVRSGRRGRSGSLFSRGGWVGAKRFHIFAETTSQADRLLLRGHRHSSEAYSSESDPFAESRSHTLQLFSPPSRSAFVLRWRPPSHNLHPHMHRAHRCRQGLPHPAVICTRMATSGASVGVLEIRNSRRSSCAFCDPYPAVICIMIRQSRVPPPAHLGTLLLPILRLCFCHCAPTSRRSYGGHGCLRGGGTRD